MKRPSRGARRAVAIAIWLAGLFLFFALGWWNLQSSRQDAENRLISEAGRTAAQIAALATLPGQHLGAEAARAIVLAAMEDERIYAVKIQARGGVDAGLRRNYLWEPVPWDDEIAENCVQGMNPIREDAQISGKVDVWLSPRLATEEDSLLERRERLRFAAAASLWTLALILLFWQWGELRHFRNIIARRASAPPANAGQRTEKIILGLGGEKAQAGPPSPRFVDPERGRLFQCHNSGAWLITAGMFRQTFARAPELLSRLYAAGELAGLCHLARMLEQAAPCIGARPLAESARALQVAINDPGCKARAAPVEACAKILEQTLAALGAKNSGD